MNKAQRQLFRGVKKLNNTVKLTLGPQGRNVIIDYHNDNPLITNDGVTIARQVTLPDRNENLGADIIKQASIKTNEEAGDGTTSAIVLAAAIIKHARHELRFGYNAMVLKDALLKAAGKALDYLPTYTRAVHKYNDLVSVATNSCGNRDDGILVAKALTKVGVDGLVTLEMNQLGTTQLQFTNGVKIKTEATSPYFNDKEFLEAKVLVTDGTIKSIKEIITILEAVVRTKKPLIIVARDFTPEVINALVLNRAKIGLPVVALRSDAVEDCAVITNATMVSPQNDLTLEQATVDHLGNTQKVIFNPEEMVILSDEKSPLFDAHINRLKNQIKHTTDNYRKTRLKERLANLTATASIISVGCPTQAATMERRLRIEDAVAATTNAMRDGIVQGGGLTYQKIAARLSRYDLGERILKKALPAITQQIQKNYHFDQRFCTAVDAATVIKSVIKNAVSAAAILLTTAGIISSAI